MIAFFPSPVKKKPKSPKRTQFLRVLRHPHKKVMKTENEEELKPGYWAVIPAQIRYAPDIPAGAKLLYAEISSLTDARGYCFASNRYFAELYGIGIRTVQRYLDALKNVGMIRITDGEGGTDRRKIYAGVNPLADPHDKIDMGGDKIVAAPMTEMSPPNNVLNRKEEQIPPKPPKGRREKSEPKYEPEMFERFWKAYPRGEDRQGAVREWDKLKPDRQLMHKMSTALARQKATLSLPDDHDHYAFQYAVRWLRYRRWEDDLEKSSAAASKRGAAPSYEPEVSAWQ